MKSDKAIIIGGVLAGLGLAVYFIYKINKAQESVGKSVEEFSNDAKNVYEVINAPQKFAEESSMNLADKIGYGATVLVNYPYRSKISNTFNRIFGDAI